MTTNSKKAEFKNIVAIEINVAPSGMNWGDWPCMLVDRIYLSPICDNYFFEKFGRN